MKIMAEQFIVGGRSTTPSNARPSASARHISFSYDMLGEPHGPRATRALHPRTAIDHKRGRAATPSGRGAARRLDQLSRCIPVRGRASARRRQLRHSPRSRSPRCSKHPGHDRRGGKRLELTLGCSRASRATATRRLGGLGLVVQAYQRRAIRATGWSRSPRRPGGG
jgi:hypothetical protein